MSDIEALESNESQSASTFSRVTRSQMGTKDGLDTNDATNLLTGVVWDFAAQVQASTTDTWTYRDGGSGGTITAVVVITYVTSSKLIILNIERTT